MSDDAEHDIALLRRALAYAQSEQVRLMSERSDAGRALDRISNAEYAHHLSGNENFERLQAIAHAALAKRGLKIVEASDDT